MKLLKQLLPRSDKALISTILISASLALFGAYFSQMLGYEPCTLCIYQRIPYFGLIIVSLIGIIRINLFKWIIGIIYLLILCELAIVLYHVGIEHHIFNETVTCVNYTDMPDNVDAALKQLEQTKFVSCANPSLVIFKLSMAEWNLLYSLGLMILIIYYRKSNVTRR